MLTEHAQHIEQQLDIAFENKILLANAFIHRSYLNENRDLDMPSNERLEFLGDACLELIVSHYLFDEYPDEPEGTLTSYRSALVNTISLAETARQLHLGDFLLLSKGEEAGGGRESEYLLANTFEALIGAMFLDIGYNQTEAFVHKHLLIKLNEIIENQSYRDPKSLLQEITQAETSYTPDYTIISESGPDHDKEFKAGVYLHGVQIGSGEGTSKQKAELQAAQDALDNWEETSKNL